MPGSRKLGRATDVRMAMLRGLVTYLFENGRIETTVTRAKEVRSLAEKYITIARSATPETLLTAKRRCMEFITKEDIVYKLFTEIVPTLESFSQGGYTRIVRTGQRRGDAAEMCIIELVTVGNEISNADKKKRTADTSKNRRTRRSPRRSKKEAEAAAPAAAEAVSTETAPAEEEAAAEDAPAEAEAASDATEAEAAQDEE
jgi:large subunit ribosomal protein L17